MHLYSPPSSLLIGSNARKEVTLLLLMSMLLAVIGSPFLVQENSNGLVPLVTAQIMDAGLPTLTFFGKLNGVTTGASKDIQIRFIILRRNSLTQGMDDWKYKKDNYKEG